MNERLLHPSIIIIDKCLVIFPFEKILNVIFYHLVTTYVC